MPHGISRSNPDEKYNRAYYGLPGKPVLFLSMYDTMGWPNRKNPDVAISAFKQAFKPNDLNVGLVLKLNNSSENSKHYSKLKELIGNFKNIHLIMQIMTREEVNGLLNVSDVAVSLHCSEGLGLLCQKAIFFGKPVIATGWSGNMDFMNCDNSWLVNYKFIPVDEYNGVSKKSGQYWAEPDIDKAVEYMKKLYSGLEYRNTMGNAGKKTIREKFSPEVCGKRMVERLKQIWQNTIDKNESELDESPYEEDYKAQRIRIIGCLLNAVEG